MKNYLKTLSLILFFLQLLICHLASQQFLDEMELTEISNEADIKSTIIRNPKQALLIVKTQVPGIRFQSNNTIFKIKQIEEGLYQLNLMPGTHRIVFQAEGFISNKQRFYFNPKDVKGVRIRVIPAQKQKEDKNSGIMVIRSRPDSAGIYINDDFYGRTPYIGKFIAGRYNLKIQKKNFLTYSEEVIIRPSETLPIQVKLNRAVDSLSQYSADTMQRKVSAALLDLRGGTSISKEIINTLSERFQRELELTDTFDLISRKKVKSILNQTGFQTAGCSSVDCAAEAGKVLNVKKMIIGDIGQIGGTFTLSIFVIDVPSSKAEHSIIKDFYGKVDDLLIITREIADDISEKYTITKKTGNYLWYWIGSGVIAGSTLLWVLLTDSQNNGGSNKNIVLPTPPILPVY